MNKFRTLTSIYTVVIILLGVMMLLYGLSFLAVSIVSVLYLAVVIAGVIDIRFNFFIKSVNIGNRDKKEIAITFDDGPVDNSAYIIDLLRRKSIKAAFFCVGRNLNENRGIAEKIISDGHIIGNHTYSHSYFFDIFGSGRMVKEINDTSSIIREITGNEPAYFRPPYGVTNPAVCKSLKSFNFTVIGWTFKTNDTSIKDVDKSVKKIAKKIKNGTILVFHDYNPRIIQILEKLFEELDNSGYKIVPLDLLIKKDAYV